MIGLVLPVYNEELRWNEDYLNQIADLDQVHVLFVNDGSTDRTMSLITEFSNKRSNVSYLNLPHNRGKTEALRQGMLKMSALSEIQFLGFLDADGAFSKDEVSKILNYVMTTFHSNETFNTNTWWWTSRKKLASNDISRKLSRHFMGRIVACIIQFGFTKLPYDTQSGFKVFQFTSELIDALKSPFGTTWFFEIELLIRMIRNPSLILILEVLPLSYWCEVPGSKITFKNVPNIFSQIVYVKKNQFKNRKSGRLRIHNGY